MSETIKIYADKSVAMRAWDQLYRDADSEIYRFEQTSAGASISDAVFRFTLPSQYYFSSVMSVKFFVRGSVSDAPYQELRIFYPRQPVDFNSVNYSTLGDVDRWGVAPSLAYIYFPEGDAGYKSTSPYWDLFSARRAIIDGLVANVFGRGAIDAYSASSEYPPYLELELGTGKCSVVPESTTPAAGSHRSYKLGTPFSVATGYNSEDVSIYLPKPVSVKFRWREKDAGTYTEIDLGAKTTCIVPANTFSKGNVEYQFVITDTGGSTSESSWVEISTEDSLSTATPVSPIDTLVDAASPVAFAWLHENSSGAPQSKAELQISNDGSTWETLIVSTGAATETSVPGGTITSGTHFWRVRTYNQDDTAGAWSSAAKFLSISAPATPQLAVMDASPRPIVEWWAAEQEAYELTIDGEATTAYGSGKRWKSPRYLDDGAHTVSVRVQNSYGRWSQPGTVVLTVSNTPGAGVSLQAAGADAAVRLSWTGGDYDHYIVYRDGVAIARETSREYLDYFSCGVHTYKVRGCYADSNNYGISAPVVVEAYPPCPVIIDVKTRATLHLDLSEQQHRTYAVSRARQSTSYHVAGRALPTADVSEFLDETLTVSAAFWTADDGGRREVAALEALLGRVVCLKTDSGDMAIGVLSAIAKTVDMFYTAFKLSVTNTDFEEEVAE